MAPFIFKCKCLERRKIMIKIDEIKNPINLIKGEIKNKTITIPKGKYEIEETIVVGENGKLIIEPGTKLLFHKNTGIIIHKGTLVAKGTKKIKIIFKSIKKEKWQNIIFIDSKFNENELEYCIIKGGNGIGIKDHYISHQSLEHDNGKIGSHLVLINSFLKMKNCIIKGAKDRYNNIYGGIYCIKSSLIVDKCTIKDNKIFNDPILVCHSNSSATLKNSKIENNKSLGTTISCRNKSALTIENCIIKDNDSTTDGAIYLAGYDNDDNSTITVKDSTFIYNRCSRSGNAYYYEFGVGNSQNAKLTLKNCDFAPLTEDGSIVSITNGTLIINDCGIDVERIDPEQCQGIYWDHKKAKVIIE